MKPVFQDPRAVKAVASRIASIAPPHRVTLMHVCGTHENAICRYGLRDLLPPWLRLVAGPGCPVCVCPAKEIDLAIRAARAGAIVTTFGDVAKVPARTTLMEARAEGADTRVVYSVADAVQVAEQNPGREVVFFAVGFETTACTTAAAIKAGPPPNFSIIPSHRIIPPALLALLDAPDVSVDGFVLPGHVSTIIGRNAYLPILERHPVPMAIAGFEPLDIMQGILAIVQQMVDGRAEVVNSYQRAVKEEGNVQAKAMIAEVFEPCDAAWRGIGDIPLSGLALGARYRDRDACMRLGLAVDQGIPDTEPGCRCGEVLLGQVEPEDCPLFGSACDPDHPVGPCMVAFEGTCQARFRYRGMGQ